QDIIAFLEAFAPLRLAESWDNVGLLVGDAERDVARVMTCLTITPESAREAIDERAELILAHHPLPFRPLKRLTTDTAEGRLLLDLIGAKIAIYSPHTAFDSASEGINQQLAVGLGLQATRPLLPLANAQSTALPIALPIAQSTAGTSEICAAESVAGESVAGELGSGRCGELASAVTLGELALAVKKFLRIEQAQMVGPADMSVSRVGVACGSGGEFLGAAHAAGCQALVTGEARFHTCLEAQSDGLGLVLAGHYASERFAVETLAEIVQRKFAGLAVWASRNEADPLDWV
ncbi:MAG TPA: Nif3-like dinuclear metal center hexameric protein, partial [Pirellulales bacterium]